MVCVAEKGCQKQKISSRDPKPQPPNPQLGWRNQKSFLFLWYIIADKSFVPWWFPTCQSQVQTKGFLATGTTPKKRKNKEQKKRKKKEQEGTGPGDPHVEPQGVPNPSSKAFWFVLTCTRCGFPPCTVLAAFVPTPFRTLLF